MRQYSITEARNNFPRIVRSVEKDGFAELTRRGRPVAFLLSVDEFKRIIGDRRDLWEGIMEFRKGTELADLDIDTVYANVRDRSPGREFTL